jgi:endonuclease/exonuclease/phosphatase family metal-dependent hydrolase
MTAKGEKEAPCSPRHRLRAALARLIALGSVTVIIAGLSGQLVRDRSVSMAILMYLPVLPVSVLAAIFDLALRGKALPRVRFGLTILATAGIALSAIPMIGSGAVRAPRSGERGISLLHWNVQWGGGLFRNSQTWTAQRSEILRHKPGIVILSEAPTGAWVDQLVADLGPGATRAHIEHESGNPYWYGLAVCSRWPVLFEEGVALPNGKGMSVTVTTASGPLRILVVDGMSSPFLSRLPFLNAVIAACHAARIAGRPYDLVVGDFNTPSRSLGFDRLIEEGYTLASRSAAGWRATFPSWLPVYDIDHVWLGRGLRVGSARFFNGPHTDHRGQIARIVVPEPKIVTTRDRAEHPSLLAHSGVGPRDEGPEEEHR